MKNKKTKLFMSLSILIICLLVSSLSFDSLNSKALTEKSQNHYDTVSFDRSDWEWNMTEVISEGSTGDSYSPSLVADNAGNMHVTWHDNTNYAGSGSDFDIFYRYWNNFSYSWSITEVISTVSTDKSYHPSLAVDSLGNVHIAWDDKTNYTNCGTDYDVFYRLWNASTFSWSIIQVISTESTVTSSNPSFAVDSLGDVYISWEDYTNYALCGTDCDIFYKRWSASSSSWTTTEVVSTESIHNSFLPSLAIDSLGNVHLAWEDYSDYADAPDFWNIFYKRWNASTSTWTITEVVSIVSSGYAYSPSLAIDTLGCVHVAWEDNTNYDGSGTDSDIFYKRWDALSSTWTTTEVVSTESISNSFACSLTVSSSGYVFIAWYDATNYTGAGGDLDIFYKFLANPNINSPELAFILPNPTEYTTVNLKWNHVSSAIRYYVYRASSYIWSVEELLLIAKVSSNTYVDILSSEGIYYYVIVASNFARNSSHSNCQFIELKFSELESPELAIIIPNPTDIDSISLMWDSIDGASEYYIYRSDTYIWSVEGLTPIVTVGTNSFIDTLPDEGFYFFVIVANDGVRNSTHSNCEYIQYKLPTLQEFTIVTSLILGTFVVIFVVMRIRKKRPKPN